MKAPPCSIGEAASREGELALKNIGHPKHIAARPRGGAYRL